MCVVFADFSNFRFGQAILVDLFQEKPELTKLVHFYSNILTRYEE